MSDEGEHLFSSARIAIVRLGSVGDRSILASVGSLASLRRHFFTLFNAGNLIMAAAALALKNEYLHDAFISYSRKDKAFVSVFEKALRRYKPPKDLKAPPRRLDVFRDTEDFTGTEYNASVARHLQASRKLIVICSPNARESDYVNDEIRCFAQSHEASDIISVLLAGIPNNEAKPGEEAELAFPEALVEQLAVPLASDYRGFDPKKDKATGGKFSQPWFQLLANVYSCTRAEIEQREQNRIARQRFWGAIAGLIALLIVVSTGSYIKVQDSRKNAEHERAEMQQKTAKSELLAAQSLQQADRDPEQALKLSLAAIEQRETELSTSALRLALARAPDLLLPLKHRPRKNEDDYVGPAEFDLAPEGRRVAIDDEEPRIVDLQTGQTLLKIASDGRAIRDLLFSPDGAWLAAIDDKHNTIVIDAVSGKTAAKLNGELNWRETPKGQAQRAVLLLQKTLQTGELDQSGTWRSVRTVAPRNYSRSDRDEDSISSTLGLSPSGDEIATLTTKQDAALLTITELDNGRTVSRTVTPQGGVNEMVWSPKGTYLALFSNVAGVHVVDTRSPALKSVFSKNTVEKITVSFSHDEKLLGIGHLEGTSTLWDFVKNKQVAEVPGLAGQRARVTFSPRADLLGVSFWDETLHLFEMDRIRKAQAQAEEEPVEPAEKFDRIWGDIRDSRFSGDGAALFLKYEDAEFGSKRLAMWKTERWQPERRLPIKYDPEYSANKPQGLSKLRLTADGLAVGVLKGDKWNGWDLVKGEQVKRDAKDLKPLNAAMFIEAGDWKLLPEQDDETSVTVRRRTGDTRSNRLRHEAIVMSKTLSPNGLCTLTTSRFVGNREGPQNGDVTRLWDTATGALLQEWHFGFNNPDGAFFAGPDRVVVLSEGDALVYHTTLCEPLESLRQQARTRMARED